MAEQMPLTVLVVDDREPNRYAVSRILHKAQFNVREASTGSEALRLAAENPDLIILDVNLPDMSGYEVCRLIKSNPATASVPVLHLSASFVASENRSEGLESGADGYLTYPLDPRELLANMQALLRARQAEKQARAQRELLHVTLSSIGDGVIATDAAGTITFINPVAQLLTGWGDDALGKPLDAVFQPVDEHTGRPATNRVAKVLQAGGMIVSPNHTLLVARDQSRRPIDDTAAPICDDEGAFVGVVVVFRDVSQRRALERELRQRSEGLAERDRRKDEFLATLAHELRNPLAPIVNSLHILRRKHAADPEADYLGGMIERQVVNLVRLVDDLLDVSRITQGKVELRKEPLELATVIERAAEAVRPMLDDRQHRLQLRLPPTPLRLVADGARIEQVLTNLLNNAAKFSPPGSQIRLSAERQGDLAVVRVADDGIGIRPEMLGSIFNLFRQGDRVAGRVSEGLGIGLTLVRQLVEMHGGKVEAHSEGPDRGSEFVIHLPGLSTEELAPPLTNPVECGPPGKGSLRVLVVDDNTDAAESLAILLRLVGGHEVRTVHDGHSALAALAEFHPEVVFLDIGLPKGMDGYEVARRIRQDPRHQDTHLIAITGYGQPEDVARAAAAGINHHLTKPADLAALQRLLAKVSAHQS